MWCFASLPEVVRNLEAMHKVDGNLMPYTLSGSETISSDIAPGIQFVPTPTGQPLQTFGTLFREFRYAQGPTGHVNAHNTAVTGHYNNTSLNLLARPGNPTVFEYYRKHTSPSQSALDAWWITNQLGAYPDLNYSDYPGYGPAYGANFIAPSSFVSNDSYSVLGNPRPFDTNDKENILKMREFFNKNFAEASGAFEIGISHSTEDADRLEQFLQGALSDSVSGLYNDPWSLGTIMNNDMFNLFFAEKVIEEFQPELLIANMFSVDVCHNNFTSYCNNLQKADYALAHLWNTIQSTPGMANDTVLIAAPEHGRNLDPNTLIDPYGRYALDHTGDASSREIFCLVLGPPGVVIQNQLIDTVQGESIDIVPTIAHILGFDTEIPGGMLPGTVLNQAFI